MTTDNKTLADVQPGGRVRLGDQRSDLVPGIVRCAKCTFQLHRTNLYVQSGTVGAGDSKTEPCPNGCGPLWPVTWETWAREGWAEAERLHLENAALSAQPSPGGQGDALHEVACDLPALFGRASLDGHEAGQRLAKEVQAKMRAALAARQPVGQFKVVAYQQITPSYDDPEVLDAKLWALPPGHPVPEGCTPLYWWTGKDAPPAQAVDLCRARASIQSLLNWIDDWAETPEESGIDAIEAEAEAVLALIDSRTVQTAQVVDMGVVREALRAAEGLATICASVDGYSREELAASGRAMRQQFTYALAKVDSQAVGE